MTTMTPAQVLERRRELLLNQDTDGFADLFAPDGAIELPFAVRTCTRGSMASKPSATSPTARPLRPCGSTIWRRSRFITPATPRS